MKNGIFETVVGVGVVVGIIWLVFSIGMWVEESRRRDRLEEKKNNLVGELQVLGKTIDGKTIRPMLRVLELENEINRLEAELRR